MSEVAAGGTFLRRLTLGRFRNYTELTVVIMLAALFFVGPVTTKDFALTLIIGMIAGTYSSIFLTFTISIVVFFAGAGLNRLIGPLRRWNIPEAVTGGLLAANRYADRL